MLNTYAIICIYTLSKYTYILPILLNTWQVSIKDPYFSWISSWKNKNNLTNLVNLLETGRPTNRHRWEVIVLFPRSQNRWLPERPKKVRSKLPKKVAKCGRFWQGSRVSTGKHPPNQSAAACCSCILKLFTSTIQTIKTHGFEVGPQFDSLF